MNKKFRKLAVTPLLSVLLVMSFGARQAFALDDDGARPGARAAALARQAASLEAGVDKACQKVAREARLLCRRQHAQAVRRLRARAESAR